MSDAPNDPAFPKLREKAFDFVQDTTKQVLTLSTAILTLTITFATSFNRDPAWESVLAAAWILYVASMLFGLWVLYALTGTLEQVSPVVPISIRGPNIVIPSLLQIGCFLLATIAIVVYSVAAPQATRPRPPSPPPVSVSMSAERDAPDGKVESAALRHRSEA